MNPASIQDTVLLKMNHLKMIKVLMFHKLNDIDLYTVYAQNHRKTKER